MSNTFKLSKSSFGKFTRYRLEKKNASIGIDFVPSRGGCLLSLQMKGHEVLDGYQTSEELDFNKWGKSGLLYPFPNRLKDGLFSWKGQAYQFPINDAFTGNALHGFGMERPLEIVEEELDTNFGSITMKGHYDGSLPYYPWPITVGLRYHLSTENGLEVSFLLQNEAKEAIPVGIGWHPYFQLGGRIDTHEFQLPILDFIGVDQRMIPTGKRYEYDDFERQKRIGSTVLDNCFAITEQEPILELTLKGERGQLTYKQETGPGKFNFLQIFTPPQRDSIAIEPMSCNINGLNNGDGLIVLEEGERFESKVAIQLH